MAPNDYRPTGLGDPDDNHNAHVRDRLDRIAKQSTANGWLLVGLIWAVILTALTS